MASISKTKKDDYKNKNGILLYFEKPFKSAESVFHVIKHFKVTVLLPVHTVMKMTATSLPIIGSFFKPGL